ncbi:MAG: InlB B-repeat-containing protein [Oscillospiraceae bacterium]|nr:InlB B-repeat-containing protein [Oscillospiraceae bacterium]
MKIVWKRTLSLILAFVMIMGNIPVNALATGEGEVAECIHENAVVAEQQDATCGVDGYVRYACDGCGGWEETLPATGLHAYSSAEAEGVIVYTCEVCGSSYEEEKPAEEPAQEDSAEEPAQEDIGFFALVPGADEQAEEDAGIDAQDAPVLNGIAWVNADAETEPIDLIGIAAKGGIRDAVLRAVSMYDPANATQYTVYCTIDGAVLNVASYRDLYNNLDAATQLANDMKNSVSQATTVAFDIKDSSGNLIAVADIGFRSFKTFEPADISLNVKYGAKEEPADLAEIIAGQISEKAKINGLTLAQLDELKQCVTYTVNSKSYTLPGLGQQDNVYTNVITATVTEGMTGETKTISGGTVTLQNTTEKYTVTYYSVPADVENNKSYLVESQFDGYATPVPAEDPIREYYTFEGWLLVDEKGNISETVGVAENVTRDTVYIAKWAAEEDNHTPGAVENNNVKDEIDDREQSFVVTYYDFADPATRKVLFEKTVPYGTYLTHPSKADALAKMEEAGVANPGYAYKQWKHADGQKGFIIKSNAAYVIDWEKVWTISFVSEGEPYETQILKTDAVIRQPAAPQRDGWKFVKWELVSGTSTDKAKDDTTYEAVWTKLHTVKFVDGETTILEQKLEDGAAIVAPDDLADTETHVFGGWELKEGTSEDVAESDTVLAAIWLEKFTITYTDGVADEEIFADFTREAVEGSTISHPAVPAYRENYIFVGWKAAEGSNGSLTANSDATFEPIWLQKAPDTVVYTITYTDGVEADLFADFTNEAVEGSDIIHPEVPAVLDDHIFGGWVVTEGEDSATAVRNVTYKATWIKWHTITYTDGVDDETVFEDFTKEVLDGELIRHPAVKRDGYAFDSWVLESPAAVEDMIHADCDRTYKATWKKFNTIIYTDGVEDEVIFADIEKTVKEGDSFKHPVVPADREGFVFEGWEKVDDTTYKAVWKQVEITITYVYGDKTSNAYVENGASDEEYVPTIDTQLNKKVIMGLYPMVVHNDVKCLKLVYGTAARSTNTVYVPLTEIEDYARKNILPPAVNPTTAKFTENVTLYLVELPDEDNNNVIDGIYKLDPTTGSVPVDPVTGAEILEHMDGAVSTTYKFYTRNGAFLTEEFDLSQNGYKESIALNPSKAYPDTEKDGIIFVEWVLDRAEEGEFVSTYYMKGKVADDTNNNSVFDVNENVDVLVIVNDAKPVNYDTFKNGEVVVIPSAVLVGKKAPELKGSTFVLDTKNGTNIQIDVDAAAGYSINKVEFDCFNDDHAAAIAALASGDDESIRNYKLTDAKPNTTEADTTGLSEYNVIIYLEKLTSKESTLVFDGTEESMRFDEQKVYESVISYPKWDSSKNIDVTYVARAEQESIPVSVEPLFQWLRDNYGNTLVDTMDSMLDEALESAGMAGMLTKEQGKHIFHVSLGEVTKTVGATVNAPVVSAQDIANKHVNNYINDFVAVMKTDPDTRDESATSPVDMIFNLPIMLADIQEDANANAQIRPFGYNAAGADTFAESVKITSNGAVQFEGDVKITDQRAKTTLSGNGATVAVSYGADANSAIKAKAAVSGVILPVSYNGQAATTYTDIGVVFSGSATQRPATATMALQIARLTADIQVPAKITKEHNTGYEGQSPAPVVKVNGNTVNNVDVISIIAGVDLNSLDVDILLDQSADSQNVTVKNVNPVAWIKLPNNIRNLLDMVNDMDVDLGSVAGGKINQNLINKLEQLLAENKMTCTLDDAIDLMESFLPEDLGQNAMIDKVLNAVKGTAEGDAVITFSGEYPDDPGVFLNMGIVADANYIHGANTDPKTGKDYGLILNGPVLGMYNNGIQLVSDEHPGKVQNMYAFESDGKTHALKVNGYEDAAIYYYGFDSDLSVHYEGDGKTAPSKTGMYLVSAYVIDENDKVLTDMAVMLVGMEKTTVTVTDKTVEHDGKKHTLDITAVSETGDAVGKTIITGAIDKPAGAGLKTMRGIINVDFPATVDKLWQYTVAHLEEKYGKDLPDTIQQATLTPAQTVEFLTKCKDKIEAKELDGVLGTVTTGMTLALDKLITSMNDFIGRTSGEAVTIQFKDNMAFDSYGVYLYHVIATDLTYVPSTASGVLIIHAAEEDFQMEDQKVPYTGEPQLPEIHDAISREQFLVIYDDNTLNFVLGTNGNALLDRLEAKGVKDGITVHDLLEKGVDNISSEIVNGLIESGDALLKAIHKEDSVLYQKAKDKLNAHVAARAPQLVENLETALNKISEVVDPDTKLTFNKDLVEPGKYQVHAYSFGIAHEEATFEILPVITITAKDQNIFVGQDISREAADATYAVNPEDTKIALPDDLGEITFNIYTVEEKDGEKVKGELAEAPLAAGTYFIEATAEKEGYFIESVAGTLEVLDLTVVATINGEEKVTVVPGELEENVVITVKVLDKDGNEISVPALTDAGYTIIDAEGNTVEADVDEEGKVTKSALAKALETAGTYTIKPVAPNVPEENIKTATLRVKEPVDYKYGQIAQIRLIEPWGLRASVRIYDDKNPENIDYSKLHDYGVYFIRGSELDKAGLTQDTVSVEDIIDDADVVHLNKAAGVEVTDGRLVAIYDKALYTYEFSDSIFVQFYIVEEEGDDPIYVPVRERNMKDLVHERKTDTVYNEFERDVYKWMDSLETNVVAYRNTFATLPVPSVQKAPTLAEYTLGAPAASSTYSYGNTAQIRLIEPWGLRAGARVYTAGVNNIDYSTVAEYGVVVLRDNSKAYSTAEEILANSSAYVFSNKNGDAYIGDDGTRILADFTKDIYTYQLDSDLYAMTYVKDADGYHYSPIRNRNLFDLMTERQDDPLYRADERLVYKDMLGLYQAITAYREWYYSTH